MTNLLKLNTIISLLALFLISTSHNSFANSIAKSAPNSSTHISKAAPSQKLISKSAENNTETNTETNTATSLAEGFDLQGHRGARGMRSEGTWPAFQFAIENQMTTLEFDIQLTLDQQFIIFHDEMLSSRICDASLNPSLLEKPITELTLAEIKSIDCTSKIDWQRPDQVLSNDNQLLSLNEFFNHLAQYQLSTNKANQTKRPQLNIELKYYQDFSEKQWNRLNKKFIESIYKHHYARNTIMQTFSKKGLVNFRQQDQTIKTALLVKPSYVNAALLFMGFEADGEQKIMEAHQLKADIISPYMYYVNEKFIQLSHQHHLSVIPWTVNSQENIHQLLKLGVDGVISDYPDRLHKAVSSFNKN